MRCCLNNQRIDENALKYAAAEMLAALGVVNDCTYDLDDFSECNLDVYHYEEKDSQLKSISRIQ